MVLFGWQPWVWQAVLTMRSILFVYLLASLACNGGAGIYYEELPEPQVLSAIESHWSSDQRTMIDGKAEFSFDLEADVQSFLLVAQGRPDAEYLITDLEGPDGTLVRSEATSTEAASGLGLAAAPFFSPNRSVGDHGGATLLVPNDPRLRLSAGTWIAKVISTVSATHHVRVDRLEQRASARPAVVSLPLTVHLTGAGEMSADQAQNHPRLQRALAKVSSVFAARSITLEPLRFVDIPSSFVELEGVELRSEQAKEMLALGGDNPGINLFIIERFLSDQGLLGSVGGVSAAIPGDPRGGEIFAGVVVATSFSEDDPDSDLLGLTMAHEIGHFMGLFHTVEANGLADHISDTDTSSRGNLMHHLSRPGSENLSAQQGMVLRAYPAVAP